MNGMIAQQIAVDRPDLVRRLILIGTGPHNGDSMEGLTAGAKAVFGASYNPPENLWLSVFFTQSDASQAAGRAFLKRCLSRSKNRDTPISEKVAPAQLSAIEEWGKPGRRTLRLPQEHQATSSSGKRHARRDRIHGEYQFFALGHVLCNTPRTLFLRRPLPQ
jgi:pimeloyl-ACP methyl ester carboxylesterase